MNNILIKSYIGNINTISGFSDKHQFISDNSINKMSTNLIEAYFNFKYSNKCIISKPIYNNSTNKVEIQLFYYYTNESRIVKKLRRRYYQSINKYSKKRSRIWSKQTINIANNIRSYFGNDIINMIAKNINKTLLKKHIKVLVIILENMYNKKVIIKINRIHYPYLNAQILSKYLSYCQYSNHFLHFSKTIIQYPRYYAVTIPASIAGIKISLQGRLITQKVVPRKTTNIKIVGKFKKKIKHSNTTLAKIEKNKISSNNKFTICRGQSYFKNQLGVFTIKVEIAQRVNKKIIFT
ncbi:unnamed protein product (mitochondrion) [Jaminaea pallidilutea]|uniref:Small ribosomal subunit protein uS3m n=1 Tax=Jaminaea pallidilutea TaxID=2878321 RepID=A0AB39A6W1_9BASI